MEKVEKDQEADEQGVSEEEAESKEKEQRRSTECHKIMFCGPSLTTDKS